jgi:hypothetical protein
MDIQMAVGQPAPGADSAWSAKRMCSPRSAARWGAQEFAESITELYTTYNLPAFYVSVMFHELPADTFYVGGEQASGYIRIAVAGRRAPYASLVIWAYAWG